MIFEDREDAGRQLAKRLGAYAGRADVVVLGIPRGGVVVALEVARALDAPLDVFLAAKLSVPGQEELAFGAIAEDGSCFLDEKTIRAAQISLCSGQATPSPARRSRISRNTGAADCPPYFNWVGSSSITRHTKAG